MIIEKARLIRPYGGELADLLVAARERLLETMAYANTLPYVQVSARVACDLELLAVGAFSPLRGFMNAADLSERARHDAPGGMAPCSRCQ